MASHRFGWRTAFVAAVTSLVVQTPHGAKAQAPAGTTLEAAAAPGTNYDKAEFRAWFPAGASRLDAVLVLVPGSNGDGRPMADDAFWQDFATRHHLALVGCHVTDKKHDQPFIEEYVNVSQGSGQALLDALAAFGRRANHPELANAPLLLWGMSAGGEFDYEFVAWRPERVVAFIVNKGGIYYTALTSRATRSVPGILFVGEKDLTSRIDTITGLFAVNRRGGALWALAEEPGAAHVVGRSRDLGAILFEDVLPVRLGEPPNGGGAVPLRPIDEKSGFIGDLTTRTFKPAAGLSGSSESSVWLPTERVARAWQAVVTGKPFDQTLPRPGTGRDSGGAR